MGKKTLFHKKNYYSPDTGFTLVELLIVTSIIGILASIILPTFIGVRNAAYFVRAKAELRNIASALQIYTFTYANFPADTNRDLPPGLETFLGPGTWPKAPWPGSVYDWDNWTAANLTHEPKEQIYQISIRFCPINEPQNCKFPSESWAQNFDISSAVYYCVAGPCRSHSNKPLNHPGYCINC